MLDYNSLSAEAVKAGLVPALGSKSGLPGANVGIRRLTANFAAKDAAAVAALAEVAWNCK